MRIFVRVLLLQIGQLIHSIIIQQVPKTVLYF